MEAKSIKVNEGTQIALVIRAMSVYKKPITRRKLSASTGIEITAMCRILYEMQRFGIAIVRKIDKCESTHRKVKYYQLKKSFQLPS